MFVVESQPAIETAPVADLIQPGTEMCHLGPMIGYH